MWYLIVFFVVKVLKALSIVSLIALLGYLALRGIEVLIDLNEGIESDILINKLKYILAVTLSLAFLHVVIPDKKEALIIIGTGAMLESGIVEKGIEKIENFVEKL